MNNAGCCCCKNRKEVGGEGFNCDEWEDELVIWRCADLDIWECGKERKMQLCAMKGIKKYGVLFIAVGALVVFTSWGFLVHRTTTQLAIYRLPKKLERFFFANKDSIVKYSVRPDQRRNEDKTEGPKHFIDLEAFGDSAAWKMPLTWDEAVAKYSKDTLEKYGYVPYWVLHMKEDLTRAFRNKDRDSILFYATDIAHYIEDANVPLHTSINHDGQLTNQKGLHSLWESTIPEIELANYNLYSRKKAKYLDHPEVAIWEAVRRSHDLLPQLFNEELEATKGFVDTTKFRVQMRRGKEIKSYTSEFAKAYNQRLGSTINEQLLHSAELVADFWYTSWVDAGKPEMEDIMKKPFSKADKKEMKKENKAYKKNELLEKGWLIARRGKSEE